MASIFSSIQMPSRPHPRSFNAHKMDLDFLVEGFTQIDLNKPSDMTHNKVEKAHPTSQITNEVVHSKTGAFRHGGLAIRSTLGGSGSVQKPVQQKRQKLGWGSGSTKVKYTYLGNANNTKRKAKGISAARKNKQLGEVQKAQQLPVINSQLGLLIRDPSRPPDIYTYDLKKGYPHVCTTCKRMYRFLINLYNHDIVDHHFDRAYLCLPADRSRHSSRHETETELLHYSLLNDGASNDINFGSAEDWLDGKLDAIDVRWKGSAEQWLGGKLTILNVQWARGMFNDARTLKVCMDSGMGFNEAKEKMARLDELDRLDRADYKLQVSLSEDEVDLLKKGSWSSEKKVEKALGKRNFAIWQAAVVDNDLAQSMGKMDF